MILLRKQKRYYKLHILAHSIYLLNDFITAAHAVNKISYTSYITH